MAEYVYPAIFHENEDKSFTILFPDLPGCISEGKNLANAIYMAQSALSQWMEYSIDKSLEIPSPSNLQEVAVERESSSIWFEQKQRTVELLDVPSASQNGWTTK